MKFLVSAFLMLAAIGLVVALTIGVTLKIVGLLFMALLVVAAVSFVMRKLKHSRKTLMLDHPQDAEHLPR
jgi:membrane protein implicated in regulation of membrane protease activity